MRNQLAWFRIFIKGLMKQAFPLGGGKMNPICTAVIVAAGKGKRMGTEISKQFLPLCGKEILTHTVEKFEQAGNIRDIVLVTGEDSLQDVREMAQEYGWKKVVSIVAGGKERQDSVWNGLQMVSADTEIVLIHDGVRPFVTEDILNLSIETAMDMGGCVAGVPAKDTIKVCSKENIAVETPDRSTLWQIQTPQTFRKDLIMKAYTQAKADGFIGTDDASLAEHSGYPVKVIMGSYRNIKITTQEDLLIGEAFLKAAAAEKENKMEAAKTAVKKEAAAVKKSADRTVTIYTDGACSGNPGPGGYGVVLIYGEDRKELSEGYRLTTNNRMEVLAVIKGLEALKKPCKVNLYSDSKYVVDAIEKGWVTKWKQNGWMRNKKEKASNVDLWERLLLMLEKHQVKFIWVKGHADNPGNERCDELARMAIQSGVLLEDENYGKM